MVNKEGNKTMFVSRTFHWWPFCGSNRPGTWRGFAEQNNVTISDDEITVSYSKDGDYEFTMPIKDLEYCIKRNRLLRGFGNKRISIGLCEDGSISSHNFYLEGNEYEDFIDLLTSKKPLCFSSAAQVIETKPRWYRIDKILSGNNNTLWMNKNHIISSENISDGWCVTTNETKYFFTRGILYNNLYIGSDNNIHLSNVSNDNVKAAREFIKNHGGNIADDADDKYTDSWTLSVLFSPSLWFTHSSIGFTNKGIVFNQKTFKTNDDIFLPYEKINFATYEGKWNWFFTKKFVIYGEQNIQPARRYSTIAVNGIKEKLERAGVKGMSGTPFTPSYHSTWFGILLSIVTLSIYHWLVVAANIFSKRDTLTIGDEKIAWNGKIFGFSDHYGFEKKLMKGLTHLVFEGKDVNDVVYIKKRWFHFWGYCFIWAKPTNIRLNEGEASQGNVDYHLEAFKIWSSGAHRIISKLEDQGFVRNSDSHKAYKKWCKQNLLEISK